VDFALRNAESAFTENRFADADAAISALQTLAPGNSRLAFLSSQLQRERERGAAEENRRLSVEARQDKLRSALQQANDRIRRGALIDPDRDSALESLRVAQDLAPGDSDVRVLRERLITRLLETATQKLDAGDVAPVRNLLDAAGNLGADGASLAKLRRRADELHAGAAPAPRDARSDPAAAATPPAGGAPSTAASPSPTPPATPAAAATTPPPAAAARADTLRIYAPSELTQVRTVEVDYPERALLQKISGWAEVEFTITTDGAVRNVIVLNSEPKGVFEANTQAALRKWRYKPILENGKPVEARSRVRLRFTPAG
jgi:protein TonB